MKYGCTVDWCELSVEPGCEGCSFFYKWPDHKVARLHKSHKAAVLASGWHRVDGGRWINNHYMRARARLGSLYHRTTLRRWRAVKNGQRLVAGFIGRPLRGYNRVAHR